MELKQYYLGCLSHASYLIADEESGEAAIVDPQRDVGEYIADAKSKGYTIKHVMLTHFHADFLAGHLELREKTGATIYLGSKGEAEYEYTKLNDGDEIKLGKNVVIRAMETPGHTPEGVTYLVFDRSKSDDKPQAALTGDTLFIGDVGRPDLLASIGVTADELGDMLYDSIQRLKQLPDETLVYPAHGAGSMCGKNLSTDTVSTLGKQKESNYAMQDMSREDFKRIVTEDQPAAPQYFVHDAILNRKNRETLDVALTKGMQALSVEDVLRLQNQGVIVLDVRDNVEFAQSHMRGSLNIGLGGKYATWAGTVLSPSARIVLIADPGTEEEASIRLGRIGYDKFEGFLKGGVAALDVHPELVMKGKRFSAEDLRGKLEAGEKPVLIDIRNDGEVAKGMLEGAKHIPLSEFSNRVDEMPKDKEVIVYCAGGYRSSLARSILEKEGFDKAADLIGGFGAWEKELTGAK